MAADEDTATADDGVTAGLSMCDGTQTVQLPAGWELPGTQARVRRVGRSVVLEPIVAPAASAPPEHPGVPPGYWEWLEEARARGDFGDLDLDEVELRDLHLQAINLDDSGADEPR